MTDLLKPIVIGDYFDGGEMGWAWYHHNHSRLAIIGDNTLSPKKKMVRDLAQQFQSRDDNVVYWITEDAEVSAVNEVNSNAIPWLESFPDPPEEYVDRDHFINNRKFFASSYMQLLSKIAGEDYQTTFPRMSYRSHLEGPLNGYLRVIENLEDLELKEWLTMKVRNLENISWNKTAEGRKYHLSQEGSVYERALSFLSATWSFMALTAQMDVPQQLVLIIEPPKDLLLYQVDPVIRQVMAEALSVMKYLTEVITLTLIVSTETMFPVAEQHYRYKVYFQTKDSDLDLWTDENQQAINCPGLYEAWRQGRTNAGVFQDSYEGMNYAVFFRENNIRIMDEFHGEIS